MTLETKDDRTLFFDLLPLTFRSQGGLAVRIKVFTVPGQVIHASTRRLVVQGADGVVFVADSRISETEHNAASFMDLKENLKVHGMQLQADAARDSVQQARLARHPERQRHRRARSPGSRTRLPRRRDARKGVVETFVGLLHLTWSALDAEHDLNKKFGFDSDAFLEQVAQKLGDPRKVADIMAESVGGALEVLRPEAHPG